MIQTNWYKTVDLTFNDDGTAYDTRGNIYFWNTSEKELCEWVMKYFKDTYVCIRPVIMCDDNTIVRTNCIIVDGVIRNKREVIKMAFYSYETKNRLV